MRNKLAWVATAMLLTGSAAYAQSTVIIEETDPVTTESTVVVPGEVRTYILEQQTPSVAYEGDLAVGTVLPDTVEVHTVDGHSDYAYTVVNERRIIVNPQTRTVVQVLE